MSCRYHLVGFDPACRNCKLNVVKQQVEHSYTEVLFEDWDDTKSSNTTNIKPELEPSMAQKILFQLDKALEKEALKNAHKDKISDSQSKTCEYAIMNARNENWLQILRNTSTNRDSTLATKPRAAKSSARERWGNGLIDNSCRMSVEEAESQELEASFEGQIGANIGKSRSRKFIRSGAPSPESDMHQDWD